MLTPADICRGETRGEHDPNDIFYSIFWFQAAARLSKDTLDKVELIHANVTHEMVASADTDKTKRRSTANRADAKRKEMFDKLSKDVLRFNRITEPVMFILRCKGFQIAVAEMVIKNLPKKDKSTLPAEFNEHFFEIMFTKRVYSQFYIKSTS